MGTVIVIIIIGSVIGLLASGGKSEGAAAGAFVAGSIVWEILKFGIMIFVAIWLFSAVFG